MIQALCVFVNLLCVVFLLWGIYDCWQWSKTTKELQKLIEKMKQREGNEND
jgi:hypothetical protein